VLDEAVTDGLLEHNPARDIDTAAARCVGEHHDDERHDDDRHDHNRHDHNRHDHNRHDDDLVLDPLGVLAAEESAQDAVTEAGHLCAVRDDATARTAGDEDLDAPDEQTEIPERDDATESQPAPGQVNGHRSPVVLPVPESVPERLTPADTDDADGRDPLVGTRAAVARVGQLRADVEAQAEERARAEQLTRWHADDQTAGDGTDRAAETDDGADEHSVAGVAR